MAAAVAVRPGLAAARGPTPPASVPAPPVAGSVFRAPP